MRKKAIKKCEKSLEKNWNVRLKTKHPRGDNYDGIVVTIKDSFIVLREECDFEFDGVIILVKDFIKSCRDGKVEKCCNEIIRLNGEIDKIGKTEWLNSCENIKQVLEEMMKRDIWPAIEILFKFNKCIQTALYLGPITSCNKKSFFLKCYDASGQWEKVYELEYNEIFRIEFNSKYCDHFNHYMKTKNGA